jgi:hypothetical protein
VNSGTHPASFRDAAGFVFEREGVLLRQVNRPFQENYDHFVASGLYQALIDGQLLVPHEEVDLSQGATPDAYRVLKPLRVPFVTYPYEWCFHQLRDAALLTLAIQQQALRHDMVLRDASAYNIQFMGARPIFIDTLSFRRYRDGEPWSAYRQFCEHFLAPLALVARRDSRLAKIHSDFADGVPLDLASRLLDRRSWLCFGLLMHVHLHARAQTKYSGRTISKHRESALPRRRFEGLIEHLIGTVEAFSYRPAATVWTDYASDNTYSEESLATKGELIARYLDDGPCDSIWDLGANTGQFSRIAGTRARHVLSLDADASVVDANYRSLRRDQETKILPLVIDLLNPSTGGGWGHAERLSLKDRGPADVLLALALVHHLALGGNVPLPRIAEFFQQLGRRLIIEFVPLADAQAQRLVQNRRGEFHEYSVSAFEAAFSRHFQIREQALLPDSNRVLYLMERLDNG